MIGVFDSGRGGITAVRELRALLPREDICFFADRKNCPYGTKPPALLTKLVTKDIEILRSLGCDKILIACCTASTVFPLLPGDLQKNTFPIILPTARAAARVTKNGKIGVIATEATVASEAFGRELMSLDRVCEVTELATQNLVSLVERGASDGKITDNDRRELHRTLEPLKNKEIDTLILGCTHFPHLENEIKKALPEVNIISSSREGAMEIASGISEGGRGKTVYL